MNLVVCDMVATFSYDRGPPILLGLNVPDQDVVQGFNGPLVQLVEINLSALLPKLVWAGEKFLNRQQSQVLSPLLGRCEDALHLMHQEKKLHAEI